MAAKVAIITGASSGIGRAAALRLQSAGYDVVLAARRVHELEETAACATTSGGRVLVTPCDVTNAGSVKMLFDRARDQFGHIDVLFNNAGVFPQGAAIDDMTFEAWRRAVDVNLHGAFLCAQQAVRAMKAQDPKGGRIINNGSISAHVPRPFSIAYTATKHAITGMTKSLSLDHRKDNIACSQIDIGNAATDISEKMSTGILQANGETMSEPRMDVAHVADAILYIAELPLTANVQFMTLMATAMPYIGRG